VFDDLDNEDVCIIWYLAECCSVWVMVRQEYGGFSHCWSGELQISKTGNRMKHALLDGSQRLKYGLMFALLQMDTDREIITDMGIQQLLYMCVHMYIYIYIYNVLTLSPERY
jgi:hypothetical protein